MWELHHDIHAIAAELEGNKRIPKNMIVPVD
jgi:hypothetical protein